MLKVFLYILVCRTINVHVIQQILKTASEMPVLHCLGKQFQNHEIYKSSSTVQKLGYFLISVSYIKVQIMCKYRK